MMTIAEMKNIKTEFVNYAIKHDGIYQLHAELVPEFLMLGVPVSRISVYEKNNDIEIFNKLADDQITAATDDAPEINLNWKIPEPFSSLDLHSFLIDKFLEKQNEFEHNLDTAALRLQQELEQIEKRNLTNLFRTIVYVIDTFIKKDIPWGVGRGSSCASFILYLIGLNLVNPLEYDIPLEEFFHD